MLIKKEGECVGVVWADNSVEYFGRGVDISVEIRTSNNGGGEGRIVKDGASRHPGMPQASFVLQVQDRAWWSLAPQKEQR